MGRRIGLWKGASSIVWIVDKTVTKPESLLKTVSQSARAQMSGTSPAKKGLERPDDEAIIQGICDYSERLEIKQMLQEYMRRLIVEQPKEPLKFLVKEITENPYKLSTAVEEPPADS